MSAQPRVAVLGPVLVEAPDGSLTTLPGALARAFVATLALARGYAASTDVLIDELWADEPPKGARAALQTLVSRIRRSSADGLVASTSAGYRLAIDPSELDLAVAELAAADLTAAVGTPAAGPREAAASASSALALWRGDPGDDLEGPAAQALSGRAATAARALRRSLADALISCDDPDGAARLWAEEARTAPFDEVAVTGRMRALAAAGRGAEALAVFAEHRERLADELGADPSAELVRLNADILRTSSAPTSSVRRVGLRQAATALIGREDDLRRVGHLVAEHRLVTIVGAGGLGKTRLAQDVAAAASDDTAVVFLELAPLGDGADIVPALGALLGVAELRAGRSLRTAVIADVRTRIVRILAESPTLLVLDNCEHLVEDAAAFAGDLLSEVPGLRILTTSRAPLAIPGETSAPLAPLPVEDGGAAVRLFTERARAARPGAVLPLDAVRRICTRLDGSPLAIELAGARVRGMSVDEIERRLDDRFALLRGGDRTAPERHRTLLAVIEWSWRLLDDGAQDLLTRLALFPDGLDVAAVESVADPDRAANALDHLADLVEQSLVQLSEREGEPARYRLLETVREFGSAQLDQRGTTSAVRAAMIRWGAEFADSRNVFAAGPDAQRRMFREVEREADNLVALLRWSLRDEDLPAVAKIFTALGAYWSVRGAHNEVLAIAADIVGVLRRYDPEPDALVPTTVSLVLAGAPATFLRQRAGTLAISALRRLHRLHGPTGARLPDAQAALFRSVPYPERIPGLLAGYRDDPDEQVACFALTLSAPLAENAGDFEAALRYAERAEELAERVGDIWTSGTAAVSRAQLLTQTGHAAEALAAVEIGRERLSWFGADDDVYDLEWSLGLAVAALGDSARARRIADELDVPRTSPNQLGEDRMQYGVLSFAIRAEADRADGRIAAALDQYDRGYRWIQDRRKQSLQWATMIAAGRVAMGAEAAAANAAAAEGDGPEGRGGRAQGLQSDAWGRHAARFARVSALVQVRLDSWWLDLPIIGCALLAVALWGASDGAPPAETARLWGIAKRLGARQDFAVLAHGTIRRALAASVGDQVLADAATASSGLSRDEAVADARAALEAVRITPSACTPAP